ncbi:MAG: hypothetical protein J6L92_06530 [Clostridia bacterium]|nr:hypothetical protein [Clostridia bacterium]
MNKRIISVITCLVILMTFLGGCGAEKPTAAPTATPTVTPEPTPEPTPTPKPDIVENGEMVFSYVRANDVGLVTKSNIVAMYSSLCKYSGTKMKAVYSDSQITATDAPEILIGKTNRPESLEALEKVGDHGYIITRVGNKLVICGTEDNMLNLALLRFKDDVLKSAEHCGTGYLRFDEEDEIIYRAEEAIDFEFIFSGGYQYKLTTTEVIHCPGVSHIIRVAQGAASDGEYAYFVIRHVEDTDTYIHKCDLKTGEVVAISEALSLGHANDMTFDTKNNRLIVSQGTATGDIVSIINPDTLELIENVTVEKKIGSITYDAVNDRYFAGRGGKNLMIYDSSFNLVSAVTFEKNAKYTAQGMGSDNDYVYFPMSGTKDNIIEVYNFAGEKVTTIKVEDSFESESFFWVNNKYYINYYKGSVEAGAFLHELNFDILYVDQ